MKRRVYHLAHRAGISPDDALQRLKAAGFGANTPNDQISQGLVLSALNVLGVRSKDGSEVISDSPVAVEAPTSRQQTVCNVTAGVSRQPGQCVPTTPATTPLFRESTRCNDTVKRTPRRTAVHYLSSEEILAIHLALVEMFAAENDPISPPGVKERGLLESASHRPETSMGSVEKYGSVTEKAAALFHSLVKNHAFHNGNKRTALVSLLVFLDRNGVLLVDVDDDALFDFVLRTADTHDQGDGQRASADQEVQRINEWIREHAGRANDQSRGMRTAEFLSAVERAGGRYRESGTGGQWVVWGLNNDSVNISRSTTQLNGSVIRKYLQKLGLSQGQSGIHFVEFEDGVDPNQRLIRRFRNVLRRLSHA